MARTLMLGAVAAGLWSASAVASTSVPLKRTVGPIVFDAPAGAASDFVVHIEQSDELSLTRSLMSKAIATRTANSF